MIVDGVNSAHGHNAVLPALEVMKLGTGLKKLKEPTEARNVKEGQQRKDNVTSTFLVLQLDHSKSRL